MATLARRMLRLLLFFGLFFLAVRFVHTYPIPMTQDQQQHLIVISEEMGVRDAEALYIFTMCFIDLVAAIVAYLAIMRFFRYVGKRVR